MAQNWFRYRRPRPLRATPEAGRPPRVRGPELRLEALESRWLPSTSIPLNANTWTAIGPSPIVSGGPFSGRVSAIATDSTDANIVYVGAASGGIWKTTNATAASPSWVPLTDGQATLETGAIAIAPSNHNVIYVGTGEPNNAIDSFYGRGVLKSIDAGATWSLLGTAQFDRRAISKIVIDPGNPDHLFVAVHTFGVNDTNPSNGGVWRTLDGGTTWTNITTAAFTANGFFPASALVMAPNDPNTLYFAIGASSSSPDNGVYKITNATTTATVTQLTSFPVSGLNAGRIELAIAPTAPLTVYALVTDPSNSEFKTFAKTIDGGTTWTDLSSGFPSDFFMSAAGQGFYDIALTVDPTTPTTVYAGGAAQASQLSRSIDGGTTWTSLLTGSSGPQHADHHALVIDASGRLLDGNDGGIFRLQSQSPLTWVSLSGSVASKALDTNQFLGIALDPTNANIVYGGTQDDGTLKFNDNLGWTRIQGGDGGFIRVDPTLPLTLYHTLAYGPNTLEKSINGGTSFTPAGNGINFSDPANFYPPLVLDSARPQRLLFGTNKIYQTTDGAANWSALAFTFPGNVDAIGIGPASASVIYASSSGDVFVSTDGGTTFTMHTPAGAKGSDFASFFVDPTSSNIAYVVSASFIGAARVWRTTNAGVTWTSITGNLPNIPTWSVAVDPGPTSSANDDVVYVGDDTGVYRSDITGATWTRLGGSSLPNVQVRNLELNTGLKVLAAGTYGRGVWEILTSPLPPTLTGTVYNDANANGVRDAVETGLAGWQVYDDLNNNGKLDAGEPVTTTDAAGNYTLTLPAAGNYVLREVVQSPFVQTAPPSGAYTGTIALSQTVTGLDFGNTMAAIFTGTKFNDLNGNGARDAGEPGLAGWTIFDDLNGDGQLDNNEPSTVTDATGAYRLVAPNPGKYAILEVVQPGWTQLFPASGSYTGTATADQTVSGLDFGNYQAATVSGTVFDDLNGNGKLDTGEQPFAGATVYLDTNNNGTFDAGEPSTTTDATGAYSFTLPLPGPYHIRLQLPAGRIVTAPAGASFSGTPQSGQVIAGQDFATFQTVAISGTVFNDLNGNGVRDAGEPGLRASTVKLVNSATGAVVATTVTDAAGNFSFPGVGPGTYKVIEAARTGFTVTTPTGGAVVVTTQSGGDVGGLLFGNLSRALIAVAGGAGSLPVVNVYRASTGQLVNSIMAYDRSFHGGVHVAVGDINGDGVPDIITGTGPGGPPLVKVFDGRDGQLIEQFFAYAPNFTGGVWVAAGEFNGVGRADIITGAGPGGGPHVKVYNSRNGQLEASFFAYAPSFTGGVTVAAADVDGDGRADVITGAGPGGGPVVQVFRDRDLAVIFRTFAFAPTFTGGVFVSAGDVNGDGRADVIATPGAGGGAVVMAFNVATGRPVQGFAAPPPGPYGSGLLANDHAYANGLRVAAVDVTGDGIADYVLVPGAGRPGRVRVLDGTTRNEVYGLQQFDPSFLGGVFVGAG